MQQINLGNLKYVDLHSSDHLIEISALSQAPNLMSVGLGNCRALRQVPSLRFRISEELTCLDQRYHECNRVECQTIGHLKLDKCTALEVVEKIAGNLDFLDLSRCRFLKNFPSDIQKLKSLKCLNLSGCLYFDKLSVLPRYMIELDLSGTAIEELPSSSIEYLSSLKKLDLSNCERFKSLPTSICKLKSLKSLDLRCWKLEIFPEILEPLEHLESLNLNSTGIQVLPPSISMLYFLRSLNLSFSNLSETPEEIGRLSSLEILNLLRRNACKHK